MTTSRFCPHCGADNTLNNTLCHVCQHPLDTQPDVQETSTLLNGRYAILSEIGAGGFGAVYKTRDTQEGERQVVNWVNIRTQVPG